jgi:flavin reductase (DIM6/NTAB) family NADH-FMN oxidoreductase RutF
MTENVVKSVMEDMAYGLYIVGSSQDDEADGMMADWVMQVSFDPRLVAVALENDARTLQNIRANSAFTVNFLSQEAHSMALAGKFAQPYLDAKIAGRSGAAVRIHHKLDGLAHTRTERGAPVLDEAMAWLECEAEQFLPVGDHTLVVGRVLDGQMRREAEPLTSTYTGWNYSG